MLEILAGWLVRQPLHILTVAAVQLALWVLCRATVLRERASANVLWVPGLLCLAYAAWEWLVLVKTPEADVRFDLLLIWPLIAIATLWALLRAARGWWSFRRHET
jgi:hypothetical protein